MALIGQEASSIVTAAHAYPPLPYLLKLQSRRCQSPWFIHLMLKVGPYRLMTEWRRNTYQSISRAGSAGHFGIQHGLKGITTNAKAQVKYVLMRYFGIASRFISHLRLPRLLRPFRRCRGKYAAASRPCTCPPTSRHRRHPPPACWIYRAQPPPCPLGIGAAALLL